MNLVELVIGAWADGWEAGVDALTSPPFSHGEEEKAQALINSQVPTFLRGVPNLVLTESGIWIWIVNSLRKQKPNLDIFAIDKDHFVVVQTMDSQHQKTEEQIIKRVEEKRFEVLGGEVTEISKDDPSFN